MSALKTGLEKFNEKACIIMMVDGSDDPSTINKMSKIYETGYDLVCASRYVYGGSHIGGPLLKKNLSYLAGKSLYYLTTLPINDPTNSFKLYSRKGLNKIQIDSQGGFEIGIEIVAKFHNLGLKISETPTIWKDREIGKSKFKLFRWLPFYLKWYFFIISKNLIIFKFLKKIN